MNIDDSREYQDRGTEHFHVSLHVEGASNVDENSKVIEFINHYVTCSLSIKTNIQNCVLGKNSTITTSQSNMQKKEAVICRFNALWPVSNEMLIIDKI